MTRWQKIADFDIISQILNQVNHVGTGDVMNAAVDLHLDNTESGGWSQQSCYTMIEIWTGSKSLMVGQTWEA